MILAAGLILGAAMLAWFAPAGLRRITTAGGDPATAITCWIASIAAVLGTFAAGVGLLLVPGDHPADAVIGCWTALRHGRLPGLDETLGAAGLAVLLIVASRFALTLARRLRSGRQAHRAHLDFLRILGGRDPEPPRTLWLDHAAPLAYSIAGRPGLVVASTGLHRLPADQVAAVLCHERAHLRGRHHLLTTLTQALANALPGVPLSRHAPAAIGLLVELAADTAAVRSWGPHTVRAALLALDGAGPPEHTLAMAREAVPLRLARLAAQPVPPASTARRALTRAAAGLTLAALPTLLGLGTVMLAAAASCPAG